MFVETNKVVFLLLVKVLVNPSVTSIFNTSNILNVEVSLVSVIAKHILPILVYGIVLPAAKTCNVSFGLEDKNPESLIFETTSLFVV